MRIFISYVYFKSPSSDYNLRYFIDNEIKFKPNVTYSIVVNGMICTHIIPKLPNVTVIYRENIGYDFGGHLASLKKINTSLFDYFFFMNSGVIGPILKDKNEVWYDRFTNKINERVKLVGTAIVCLPHTDLGGFGPKVEGFFFCLDQDGIQCILKDGTIFYNHKTKVDAILNGEYALTKCILNNNYSIDCMLKKYKNIDWLDKKNYYVNNNLHPSRKNSYFGKNIDPFEVVFHKWFWHGESNVSLDVIEDYTKIKFNSKGYFDLIIYFIKKIMSIISFFLNQFSSFLF